MMAGKTLDQYLLELRQTTDQLRARVNLLIAGSSNSAQDRMALYFVNRAIEIGEACFRVAELRTPIIALLSVLCEDFLWLFGVSRSEANANDYEKAATSEWLRAARVSLTNSRARVMDKETGRDITKAFVPEMSKHIFDRIPLEQVAGDTGLASLYDGLYRFSRLEVHAKPSGVAKGDDGEAAVLAAMPAIVSLLSATTMVIDNRATTATEVLRHVGIED